MKERPFTRAEVLGWIQSETEHTGGDLRAAWKIVLDHLREHGPWYYRKYMKFLQTL